MDKIQLFNTINNVYGVFEDNTFYPWMNIPSGVIRIVLLKNCNFKCPHCFAEGDANRNLPILKVPYIIRIMEFAKKHYGVRTARLTGGEPLLYPHLKELLSELKRIDIQDVDITTNGVYLKEYVPLLKRFDVTNIKVSICAIDPVIHQKLSGLKVNTIDQVMAGVMLAKKNDFKITVALTCLDNIPLKEIFRVMEFAKNNGFVFRISEPYYVLGRPETKGKKNFHKIVDYLKKHNETFIHSQCESVDYFNMPDGSKVTVMHNLCDNRLCDVCTKYLYVRLTPDKMLKPCLSRTDTEVPISDTPTDKELHLAFIKAGAFLGKGLSKNDRIGLNFKNATVT